MKILFNDIIQYSNAPLELKSPALAEIAMGNYFAIELDKPRLIDAIGIGNCNGSQINAKFDDDSFVINYTGSGLYRLDRTISTKTIEIANSGTYIGRFGAGIGVHIPTSVAKEPSFNSTAEPRVSLSGQTMPGLGGYIYKAVSLDSRYKINEAAMREIEEGYRYIGMGYPFFIDLKDEAYKLPFDKLYAAEKNQRNLGFESGVRKYLYSRRWVFEERF